MGDRGQMGYKLKIYRGWERGDGTVGMGAWGWERGVGNLFSVILMFFSKCICFIFFRLTEKSKWS